MNNFGYQWRKRGSNIPDKVSGVNETVLAIPNLAKSDGGKYFCIVTNEWGRKVKSNDVMLSVEGTCIYIIGSYIAKIYKIKIRV